MTKNLNLMCLKHELLLEKINNLYNYIESADFVRERFLSRCFELDKIRGEFEEVHINIIASFKSDDLNIIEYKHKYNEFEEKFAEIKYKCYSLTDTCKTFKEEKRNNSNFDHVKLPNIMLPTFSGDYREFSNFIGMFDCLIHENVSLSNLQKKHYLVSCLKNEAFDLVKHLSNNAQDYEIARDLLIKRFSDKRLTADTYLSSILALPKVESNNRPHLREFINSLHQNTRGLASLGFPINNWSFILLHIFCRKIDNDLRSRFELHYQNVDIPSFDNFLEFLEGYCKTIETTGVNSQHFTSKSNNLSQKKNIVLTSNSVSKTSNYNIAQNCQVCDSDCHAIYKCKKLIAMKPRERRDFVKSKLLCFNCLRPHLIKNCFSKSRCQICNQRHNSLLHIASDLPDAVNRRELNDSQSNTDIALSSLHICKNSERYALLATAIVRVSVNENSFNFARVMFDSGSTSNFITNHAIRRFGLSFKKIHNMTVSGIGNVQNVNLLGQLNVKISSRFDTNSSRNVELFVIPKITSELPTVNLKPDFLKAYSNLQLADPYCYERSQIDILLGASECASIFNGKKLSFGDELPTAFSTIYGWTLLGDIKCNIKNTEIRAFSCVTSLDETLKSFWETENISTNKVENPLDIYCEKHFIKTHSRTPEGRFIVRLPFKQGNHDFGQTKQFAENRLVSLKQRLSRDCVLKLKYTDFMLDYLMQGHMELITREVSLKTQKYFIPHHAVYKTGSDKLRCVFDASMKGSTGLSLNDSLLAGPKLQQDIIDIILNFRMHEITFSADIKQMYRQILVHPADRSYQLVLWHNSGGAIKEYQLNTVTYGITSAPFLAMRCIHELAIQHQNTHPRASHILLHDIFVDDIVSGACDITTAINIKNELIDLLSQGGFELRKWTSNCPKLLSDLPADFCDMPLTFTKDSENTLKILGFRYSPIKDIFFFHVDINTHTCTKRGILSKISSIYDPNGWIAPCVIHAKILMQKLWILGIDWNQIPPSEILREWNQFCHELSSLQDIKIERKILGKSVIQFDLHGFSDASQFAYSACVYMRCVHADNSISIHLLIGKTRVAPIKQRLTIPKLELSGSLLVAKLLNRISASLRLRTNLLKNIYAWSDSSIVLCWIRTQAYLLKVFESHRVSEIQNLLSPEFWRYVPTELNPADVASRGIMPRELATHKLWWGPSWLALNESSWPAPCKQLNTDSIPGFKPNKVTMTVAVTNVTNNDDEILNKFSSFTTLVRVIAWCRRFIKNCSQRSQVRYKGSLLSDELEQSTNILVHIVQNSKFSKDIDLLKRNKYCSTGLRRLRPFIDNHDLLRVGGRLTNSTELNFSSKHPLVLPHSHHLTNLIIDHYHIKYLHAGLNHLLAALRSKFWIMSARRIIRTRINKCVRCFRLKCKPPEPIMGNLPASRIAQGERPFISVATDFTGHFNTKASNLRNSKIIKSYLCIFVCLATRAVHLEMVSDLTTEAFLAALRRFVARRGLPREIWSDSGTNFKGGCRILNNFRKEIIKDRSINNFFLDNFIQWRFSPPLSPHFNGLAEAVVKSSKNHLKRVIGDRNLTFEEFTTVFTQIEAILNSRPLCPVSNDINSLDYLSPGHFIIGAPLVPIPEPRTPSDVPLSLIRRWHLTKAIVQHVWHRWSHEYLHTLQQRAKWNKPQPNVSVGDLVLLKEDDLPPLQWRLARIVRAVPGQDSVIRVVEVKTANGNFVRSVAKVCPLPLSH